MNKNDKQNFEIRKLCVVCGLFCGACPIYIGTNEDPQRLKSIAYRHRVKPEDMECHGCRAGIGYKEWFKEKILYYLCPNCHTLNSAYDIVCRNCGTQPSCEYVKLHKKAIESSM